MPGGRRGSSLFKRLMLGKACSFAYNLLPQKWDPQVEILQKSDLAGNALDEYLDCLFGWDLCFFDLDPNAKSGIKETHPYSLGLVLPPGPPGRFLIGNLYDLPSHHEWETYSEWANKYGDLVYLNVLGTSMLYINSADLAYELFEKRSAIYSDRPMMPMLDLMGCDWGLTFMSYGARWRRHRQLFHQTLNGPQLASHILSAQLKGSRDLLQRLHKSPDKWVSHIRHSVGAAIMEIAYGIEVLPENDPYITIAETAVKLVGSEGSAGAHFVNTIPILRYTPEWMLGGGFKKTARIGRKILLDMPTVPFKAVKEEIKLGTAKPSLTATLLEDLSNGDHVSLGDEELTRNVAGVIYAAGSDTTAVTLQIFILLMVLYPEAQYKAQRELDQVIGQNRLPEFDDREHLPYTNALCKEVLRWHPVLTTAFPHRLTQDDIIGQYFIPAGTMVFGNVWGILHSESTYGSDAMLFRPERFLGTTDSDMKDPKAAFGFGRRACPGRAMAESTLFITFASLLQVFNFSSPHGCPAPDINGFSPGLFSRPDPFDCSIVPRSSSAEKLIMEMSNIL
ncbi:cytochrome P450 [Hysterangium stoloniferum]|nr:cytochrome P450 [Hysterangium stoloniferum]